MAIAASSSDDYNSLFYAAIMDEDIEGIQKLSLMNGNDHLIELFHVTHRKIFWKAHSIYPLHLAAINRKLESMRSLLLVGADPEKRDKQGRTTLHLVITSWPRFQTCTEKCSTISRFQALLIGVREKAEACLQLLCEHGVNINAEVAGIIKETALHVAVSYSAASAVQILTRYGAKVNVVDGTGMTALHRAAGTLNKNIILHLINQGADINMGVKNSGNTPLHMAVNACTTMMAKPHQENLQCITELLKYGADPNATNNQDMTPLQEACCMGCTEIVDLLLSFGGRVNKVNKARENCLFMFLNTGTKVTNNGLLGKLLGLTTPLIFHNNLGNLPSSLMPPYSCKLTDAILRLAREPRSLKSICKAFIYLQHVRNKSEWKQILPSVLFEFVFNEWDDLDKILSDA